MHRFLCIHTVPPGSLSRDMINQATEAAQRDPEVRGYRSFICLSEGKIACVLEADSKQAVWNWFQKMGLPVDSVSRVELEGERGMLREVEAPQMAVA